MAETEQRAAAGGRRCPSAPREEALRLSVASARYEPTTGEAQSALARRRFEARCCRRK